MLLMGELHVSDANSISERHTASKKHSQGELSVLGDSGLIMLLLLFLATQQPLFITLYLSVCVCGGCMCFELCSLGQDRCSRVSVWPVVMCVQVMPNCRGK